jgi:hypothetical protein
VNRQWFGFVGTLECCHAQIILFPSGVTDDLNKVERDRRHNEHFIVQKAQFASRLKKYKPKTSILV